MVCALALVSFSLVTAQKTYTYKFQDAAVNPEYVRNYQIDVGKEDVHFVVSSGTKTYFDEVRVINKYQYKAFIANITECYVNKKPDATNDGCTGGTTETFSIKDGNNTVEGYVYRCGGTEYGNLKGDVAKAAKLFKDMVPGFDYKLSTTTLKK